MSRINLRYANASGLRIFNKLTLSKNVQNLANTEKVMDADEATLQILDPGGGDTDVLLPPEAVSDGLVFIFHNNAGAVESLIIKDDGDSATIATVADTESAICFCDGTTWFGMVGGVT